MNVGGFCPEDLTRDLALVDFRPYDIFRLEVAAGESVAIETGNELPRVVRLALLKPATAERHSLCFQAIAGEDPAHVRASLASLTSCAIRQSRSIEMRPLPVRSDGLDPYGSNGGNTSSGVAVLLDEATAFRNISCMPWGSRDNTRRVLSFEFSRVSTLRRVRAYILGIEFDLPPGATVWPPLPARRLAISWSRQ